MKTVDLTGRRFGRLVVSGLAPAYKSPSGVVVKRWRVVCDCGVTKDVLSHSLTSGKTASCGCIHREQLVTRNSKHGSSGEGKGSTYQSWRAMMRRCNDPGFPKYATYGAVGITVTPDWSNYANFVRDMGLRPPGMTIDRIDNNLGYSKANCQWATSSEQRKNQKRVSSPPGA